MNPWLVGLLLWFVVGLIAALIAGRWFRYLRG